MFCRRTTAVILAILASAIALSTATPVKEVLKRAPGYTGFRIFVLNLSGPAFDRFEAGHAGPVSDIWLLDPAGIAEDSIGNVYISDRVGVIWKITPNGMAHVIAGTGRHGRARPGQYAVDANLGEPQALAIDGQDRLYIADSVNNVILRIGTDGRLERVAGDGRLGYRGDGGPAIDASLYSPFDIRIGPGSDLYIADVRNNRIRRVTQTGVITTVAGTGLPGYSGDAGPANAAALRAPFGIALDARGHIYIADSGNNVVRTVDADDNITTIAGSGQRGYDGDNGPAVDAWMNSPQFLLVDDAGKIFVADEHNHAIRVISAEGTISTLLGGVTNASPENLPSRCCQAQLDDPEAMLLRADGSLLVVDSGNARVVRLDPDGTVGNFAGRSLIPEARF